MRNREEIMNSIAMENPVNGNKTFKKTDAAMLEVLLDIRELLMGKK